MPFLTLEHKQYYQQDLEQNLDYLDDGVWEFIEHINENPNLQTIFSRKPDLESFEANTENYLYLAYLEDYESEIQEKLLDILDALPEKGTKKSVTLMPAFFNDGQIVLESTQGYRNNPNFFNVNHFIIRFSTHKLAEQTKFWSLLTKHLKS